MKNFDFLYQETKPHLSGFLNVDNIHQIHYEVYGNLDGIPLIYLHGGPGGGTSPKAATFFDHKIYKIILFDQRGCGKSLPFLETKNNNLHVLIEDINKLKKHLNIDKFVLFGGSWGTTLALCYAIKYSENILAMLLRGVFLGRNEDIEFLYEGGAGDFYPKEYQIFSEFAKKHEGANNIETYYKILHGNNQTLKEQAARIFSNWESSIVSVKPNLPIKSNLKDDLAISFFETLYFYKNHLFGKNDNYILENAHKITGFKTYIVHGHQDVDCRPIGAYLLSKKLENVELNLVDCAGHTIKDYHIAKAIVKAQNDIANYLKISNK